MKGYIFKFLLLVFTFMGSIGISYAAGEIDHFEVVLGKENAKTSEALDVTITAVDKNKQTITDYTGDIIVFSESDDKVEFPKDLSEGTYKFKKEDNGSVKFENAVVFKTPGVQDLYVYDMVNDKVYGLAEATITDSGSQESIDIEILSPENGVSLGKNIVTVSGKTQKNHQVQLVVNNTETLESTSNEEGVFEVKVEKLVNGTNTFVAKVLDSDNKVVGTSTTVSIKIEANLPELKRITITPNGEVPGGTEISIEVVSNSKLSQVSAIINDGIITLKETKDGIYTTKTKAPMEEGKYPVDVVLVNEFGNKTENKAVETLQVSKVELNAPMQETVTETGASVDLSIKDIRVTKLKTKSILTWKKVDAAESYNIYKKVKTDSLELIANVKEPRFEIEITGEEIKYEDFAIRAVAKDGSGETIEGDISDMTKIQTGPELYLLFALLALLMSSGIFYFRRKESV